LDHRKKFYRALYADYCIVEFAKLKSIALERWAENFVRKNGYRISAPSIKKIAELAGSDMQNLASELEKLFLYAGSEKRIPDAIVDDLVNSSREYGIFDLIEAVGQGDGRKALRLLANLMDMGENPLFVANMIARHCRQLLIAKEYLLQRKSRSEIGRAAQIPAFLLEKFLNQARKADAPVVREMYVRIAHIDRRIKSSSGDGRLLLEELICSHV